MYVSRKGTNLLIPPSQVNGAKTLVLDPTLAGPLGLVTEVALLKVRTRVTTTERVHNAHSDPTASWSG